MKNKKQTLSRRNFINKLSCFGIGSCLCILPKFQLNKQEHQTGLWHEFSPDEKKIVDNSELVKLFLTMDYKKWSCAESTLLAILKYVDKPEEFVQSAAGFGGGLGHGELCGMITGGIMGIGVIGNTYLKAPKEIDEYIEYARDEYLVWWKSKAPLRCDELTKRYEGIESYLRMGKGATAKLDELIQVIKV